MALSWRQPGNPHLYVSDPVANAIRVYDISMADGGLAPASFGPYTLGGAGSAPEQLVLAGHNPTLYAASSAGLIFAFSANADGSPFPAAPASGDLINLGANWYLPDASTNSLYAYQPSPLTGALNPVHGSPFQLGEGPLELELLGIPIM